MLYKFKKFELFKNWQYNVEIHNMIPWLKFLFKSVESHVQQIFKDAIRSGILQSRVQLKRDVLHAHLSVEMYS